MTRAWSSGRHTIEPMSAAPPAPGPYLQTVSGRWVNPFDPDPSQLDAGDIARALANQCRFGGHSRVFYSVAQHSVIVADLVEQRGGDAEDAFAALMHDATEAYLGDMPHPLKHRSPLGAAFREAEDHLERALRERFRIKAGRAGDQARRPRPARHRAARVQRRDVPLAGARGRRAARHRAGGVAARRGRTGVRRALRRAGRPALDVHVGARWTASSGAEYDRRRAVADRKEPEYEAERPRAAPEPEQVVPE